MNNIHITILGKGNFPLVFFHGWGFDHRIWLELAGHLAEQYQLYLVDLPGFGASALMDWAEFKKNLLPRLPAYFSLIGWSMGGLMATRLALEEPLRIKQLINIASSPRFLKENDWPGIESSVFNRFFANLAANPQQTIQQFIKLQLRDRANIAYAQFIPELEGLQAGLEILAQWDLRKALDNLVKPTCFIFGRLDAIIPRSAMVTMQKAYPAFKYAMLTKAAHIPFLSHPKEFLEILQDFLQ